MRQPSTERIGQVFDKMARKYDRQMGFWERILFGDTRQWATSQAHGDVLEIAVGTGLNLPHYSADTRIVGIDLSEGMLDIARKRVANLGLADRIELRQGNVQALDLPDASIDTVVSTFTFCTIPDPAAAAREARRVLRPGGQFVLVEHGPSSHGWMLAGMRLIERLTVRFGADHLTRDPEPYLAAAGFDRSEVRRSKGGIVFRVLARKTA
jgi:ubiquinone/menaquinone biosynthesis C-methylase UbiE